MKSAGGRGRGQISPQRAAVKKGKRARVQILLKKFVKPERKPDFWKDTVEPVLHPFRPTGDVFLWRGTLKELFDE